MRFRSESEYVTRQRTEEINLVEFFKQIDAPVSTILELLSISVREENLFPEKTIHLVNTLNEASARVREIEEDSV